MVWRKQKVTEVKWAKMINLSKEKSVPKLKFTRPIISLPVYCIGETQKCYVLQKQPERGKKISWKRRQYLIHSFTFSGSWYPFLNSIRTHILAFYYPINCDVKNSLSYMSFDCLPFSKKGDFTINYSA